MNLFQMDQALLALKIKLLCYYMLLEDSVNVKFILIVRASNGTKSFLYYI